MAGYTAILQIHLHFPDNGSLKGKRKELQSVKAHLHQLGAAVAETDHHELWQRATLTAAVVGRSARDAGDSADRVERWLDGHFPQGARVERTLMSTDEVLD